MQKVRFTSALKRFFPSLKEEEVKGKTVSEVLNKLEEKYPGMKDYLLEEGGRVRKHINIFIGDQLVDDREGLSDVVKEGDEILIFQALSGG